MKKVEEIKTHTEKEEAKMVYSLLLLLLLLLLMMMMLTGVIQNYP
jgi:uncharacterized membrane protein